MNYGVVLCESVYNLMEKMASLIAYEFDGPSEPTLDVLVKEFHGGRCRVVP